MSILRLLFPFTIDIDVYNGPRNATRDSCCVEERKGEKSGGGGEGIIANREKYEFAPGFFRDSCVANSKRINLTWRRYVSHSLSTSGKFA